VCLTDAVAWRALPRDGFTYPTASGSPDRRCSLIVDAVPLTIPNDIAVPLALNVNELLTNALQHTQPADEDRVVHVAVRSRSDDFSVTVSDAGVGPDPAQTTFGLGTRLVDATTRQINATIKKQNLAGSYTVTVTVPATSPKE
jgi:two-component sensor histidine kinase